MISTRNKQRHYTPRRLGYLLSVAAVIFSSFAFILTPSASAAPTGGATYTRYGIGIIASGSDVYISDNPTTMGTHTYNFGNDMAGLPTASGDAGVINAVLDKSGSHAYEYNRIYLKKDGKSCSVGSSHYYDSVVVHINGDDNASDYKMTSVSVAADGTCSATPSQQSISVGEQGRNNGLLLSNDKSKIISFNGSVTFEKQAKTTTDGKAIYVVTGGTPQTCGSAITLDSDGKANVFPMSTSADATNMGMTNRVSESWNDTMKALDPSVDIASLSQGCAVKEVMMANDWSIDFATGETFSYSVQSNNTLCNQKYGDTLTAQDGGTKKCEASSDPQTVQNDMIRYRTMDPYQGSDDGYKTGVPLPVLPANIDISAVAPTDPTSTTTGSTTCGVTGGFGWVICPVTNFLAGIVDTMYTFIQGQLAVRPELFSSGSGTYTAWQVFRDYANIAFIIAFLIIVYSQATSAGVGNYGIKKMLPRLIAAAILVNISYILCQLAIDVANVLGYSIAQLFYGIEHKIGAQAALDAGSVIGPSSGANSGVAQLFAGILIGGVLLVVALALGLIGPILIAVVMVFLILLLRQALVVILIVISPLAFVAYLLPNTEKWFQKWWKTFSQVLLVFPIVALVVGGSAVASKIISTAASSETDSSTAKLDDKSKGYVTQLIAVGVLTVPFFVIPGLLKKSLDATGSVGAKIRGMGDKATGRVSSKAKKRSEEIGKNVGRQIGNKRAGMASSKNRFVRGLGGNRKIRRDFKRKAIESDTSRLQEDAIVENISRNPGDYTERQRADAASTKQKRYEEEVKTADSAALQSNMTYADRMTAAKTGIYKGRKLDDAEKDAHIRFAMSSGNATERREILETADTMTREQRRQAVSGARAKGDTELYGSTLLGQIEETGHTTDASGAVVDAATSLQNGTVSQINNGAISAPTATRDVHTVKYIQDQAQNASATAHKKLDGSITSYRTTPQGKALSTEVQAVADSIHTTSTTNTNP